MPNTCGICNVGIACQSSKIKCSSCSMQYHSNCVSPLWTCYKCINESQSKANEKDVKRKILKQLLVLQEKQKLMAKSIEICHEKIDNNNQLLKNQESLINSYWDKIGTLSTEVDALQNASKKPKLKLDARKRRSTKATVSRIQENISSMV